MHRRERFGIFRLPLDVNGMEVGGGDPGEVDRYPRLFPGAQGAINTATLLWRCGRAGLEAGSCQQMNSSPVPKMHLFKE